MTRVKSLEELDQELHRTFPTAPAGAPDPLAPNLSPEELRRRATEDQPAYEVDEATGQTKYVRRPVKRGEADQEWLRERHYEAMSEGGHTIRQGRFGGSYYRPDPPPGEDVCYRFDAATGKWVESWRADGI